MSEAVNPLPCASRSFVRVFLSLLIIVTLVFSIAGLLPPPPAPCAVQLHGAAPAPPPRRPLGSRLRVAVLLSGQPRTIVGRARTSWRAFLAPYDVDVFAHFWYTTGADCEFHTAPSDLYATGNKGVNCFDADLPTVFAREWAPVAVEYEKSPREDELLSGREFIHTFQPSTPFRTIALHTSMQRTQRVFERAVLRNSSLQYDWIIRGRTDLAFLAFPDLSRLERGFIYFEDEQQGGTRIIHDEWMRNEVFILPGDSPPEGGGQLVTTFPPGATCAGCAATLMRSVETMDESYAAGVMMNDEQMMFAHCKRTGLLSRMRALPQDVLAVAITRDGINPANTAEAPALPYDAGVRGYTFKGFAFAEGRLG